MRPASASSPDPGFVDVGDLEVGMYIQLDLGWMSHPFPLNSFRVSEPGQIETLRSLGLERVRWLPDRSDTPLGPSPHPAAPTMTLVGVEESVEVRERRRRREALAAQRESMRSIGRRFAEASAACRQVFDLVATQPQQARARCEALTRAFLAKLLASDADVSMRLLGETASDKASLHALNVSIISLLMGRVFGLAAEDMHDLGVGALLHDIGKADLPERMRWSAEHFTPSERRYYEEHVALGVQAARRMGVSDAALAIIAQHHERADGSGFPQRLSRDRQTMAARIVALVDRYDDLCNPHLPQQALTPHEALSLMFAQGKDQFDTAIMGAFIKMMGVYPPGSAVQLTDDRYALVTAVNSSRPLKPRVLVYDPKVPRDEALLLDLQLEPALGIRRSLKPLALPRPALDYLAPGARTAWFFEPAQEHEPLAA